MARSRICVVVVAAALTTAVGCQKLTEESPAAPTPVSLVPLLIPVVGTPTPTPTPKPGPTPTPTPKPTPTPTPTPPPSGSACSLPPSNPGNPQCRAASPSFLGPVDQSITRVTELYPSLFNFNDKKCENCYFVKDPNRYVAEVVKELGRRGLCALSDGEEIGVKSQNSFNDQYDILVASNHIRRGAGSYRVTCYPAWF